MSGYSIWAQEKIKKLKKENEEKASGIPFSSHWISKTHPVFLILAFKSETDKNIFILSRIPNGSCEHNIMSIDTSFTKL